MERLISILLPAYNVARYIAQCLDSLMIQDLEKCEIIIVDDGSTDGTGLICDEYSQKYADTIKVIHKSNGGLLSARRVGISHASGEYCMFVDSDDYLQHGAIACLKTEIALNSFPDVVIYNYCTFDEATGATSRHEAIFEDRLLFDKGHKNDLFSKVISGTELNPLWTKLIKRELLLNDTEDYSRNINHSYGEDILQSLYPLTKSESVLYIADCLYVYRLNSSGMIRTYTYESLKRKESDDRVSDAIRKYMAFWGRTADDDISLFESRVVNIICRNIRLTMANTPILSENRKKLYAVIDEIRTIRQLNCKKNIYSGDFFHRMVYFLVRNKCYLPLHLITRLLRRRSDAN